MGQLQRTARPRLFAVAKPATDAREPSKLGRWGRNARCFALIGHRELAAAREQLGVFTELVTGCGQLDVFIELVPYLRLYGLDDPYTGWTDVYELGSSLFGSLLERRETPVLALYRACLISGASPLPRPHAIRRVVRSGDHTSSEAPPSTSTDRSLP